MPFPWGIGKHLRGVTGAEIRKEGGKKAQKYKGNDFPSASPWPGHMISGSAGNKKKERGQELSHFIRTYFNKSFSYILCFFLMCFYGISVYANVCFSPSIYVSWTFLWLLFCLFVLFYSGLSVLFILLLLLLIIICLFVS